MTTKQASKIIEDQNGVPNNRALVTTVTLNVYQRLQKVMEDVSYLQKDAKNSHHGYAYITEAAVTAAAHDSFAKHGLIFTHSIDRVEKFETSVNVWVDFALINAFNPQEQITGKGIGSAPSKAADKAIPIAITMSVKYWLMKTLLLSTGEDSENDILDEKQKELHQLKKDVFKLAKSHLEGDAALAEPKIIMRDFLAVHGEEWNPQDEMTFGWIPTLKKIILKETDANNPGI